jgi:hypothetical protein
MEEKQSFVDKLKQNSTEKLFSLKESIIASAIDSVSQEAERQSNDGFFNCSYTSAPMPISLFDHFESIQESIRNRLIALGFPDSDDSKVYLRKRAGYQIEIQCNWKPSTVL